MLISRELIYTRSHFWIGGKRIEEWANRKRVFFILATGRSGTAFLADLLNQASGATVVHEPVKDDFRAYLRAFHSSEEAEDYIHRFRKKEIYLRARRAQIDAYGEVNSLLRRHVYALMQAFPKASFLHLVRDGRDVVRSMMARATMTSEDPNTAGIHPDGDDVWADRWAEMDRLARLCWYWQVENAYLRNAIGRTVQFEGLTASYQYLREHVLDPCGLDLSRAAWQASVARPRNVTANHRMPHWSQWTPKQKRTFEEICRPEMNECGYQL